MIKNAKIGVVILAAGSSSRLGFAKQLVEFKGKSLLQHTIDASASLQFDSKVLILGARKEEIENEIDARDFNIVMNENWEEGMSTSIKKGITRSLKFENELEHILILLSDQPFVTKKDIEELIKVQLEEKTPATFSEYKGISGVPAIFSRKLFPDLEKLKGDQGAKKLLFEKSFEYHTIKFENGIFDVDTPEDIELLNQLE